MRASPHGVLTVESDLLIKFYQSKGDAQIPDGHPCIKVKGMPRYLMDTPVSK